MNQTINLTGGATYRPVQSRQMSNVSYENDGMTSGNDSKMDLNHIRIGFIGAGNMAQALAKGVMTSGMALNKGGKSTYVLFPATL